MFFFVCEVPFATLNKVFLFLVDAVSADCYFLATQCLYHQLTNDKLIFILMLIFPYIVIPNNYLKLQHFSKTVFVLHSSYVVSLFSVATVNSEIFSSEFIFYG